MLPERIDSDTALAAEQGLWREAVTGRLSTRLLTTGHPFCAGVVIEHEGNILVTLSAEGVAASSASGTDWYVGGVGGGQEPGEDLWECASREAFEELGVAVDLVPVPLSYLHDISDDSLRQTKSVDQPAPFILQRLKNADPTRPFKPGNPAGHYTYLGLFLARLKRVNTVFHPADEDIRALVWIPMKHWSALAHNPTWEQLEALGAAVAAGEQPAVHAHIHVSPNETLNIAAPLLIEHRDVLWGKT